MTNKYRVGDKLLIEFEVTRPYQDGSFHAKCKGSATGFSFPSQLEVHTHTPKPVEPAAGQVWKLVEPYYAGVRKVYGVVDIDGVTHVIVQNSIPRAARILDIKSFKKDFVYVSG